MPVYDLHRFEADVNKSCQSKKPFGSTLMNRCKSKNLNMFIETASKMVRGLSAQRDIARKGSVRTHNNSVEKRNSGIIDASPLIPSKQISLQKDASNFSKFYHSNFASHYRTKTMNVDDALKYSGFKSMTQKNSFIEGQK